LACALCLSLLFAACASDSSAPERTGSKTAMSAAEIAQIARPQIEPPSGQPPERLVVKDLAKGWGIAAEPSDEVTIEYVGAGYDGVERWRSRGRLEAFRFLLGGYGVIPGWEQGVVGMRVGGRRELIVPARLASGEGARIYVIDLLAVHRQTQVPTVGGAADGPQDPGRPTWRVPNRPPPRHLVVEELRRGSGPPLRPPATATVKYLAVDYATGTAFFNAWGPSLPSVISLADPQSVWTRGLTGMKVGGQRRLVIPAKLGFGSGPLIYAVELTSID
jgi:peptidylprolyl isomerase